MNFSEALEKVKQGKGMRLPHWKSDVIIKAQFPDENSEMMAPYLYVESRYGKVPWKETFIELFSKEWEIVDDLKSNVYYRLRKAGGKVFNSDSTSSDRKWSDASSLFDFFSNMHGCDFIDYCHSWVIDEFSNLPEGALRIKTMPIYEFIMEQYNKNEENKNE